MRNQILILLLPLFAVPMSGQDIDSVVIPAKAEIFVTLQRSLSTRTMSSGDRFYGEVSVPVTVNDKIVIPIKSSIIGHVDLSKRAGRVKGKAAIELKFDSVILPDGTTREIRAAVQSAENYSSSEISRTEGTIVAEGNQGEEVAADAASGGVKGAVVGAVAGRSLKGAGVGGLIGAAGGAILGVFKRGKEVELRRGDSVTIQLTDAVRFVRPEPIPQERKLE